MWCGRVLISYPFGIGRNCSANEWFNIICKSWRPYLSALDNVEVLDIGSNTVIVQMSVNKGDCKNPIKDSNLLPHTSNGQSPFRISRSLNRFVFKGCGNGAIMENGTIVAGCSTTCGKDTVSDVSDLYNCFGDGCCQTTIPHDMKSVTFNLTGSEKHNGDRACGSAFLVDSIQYSQDYNSQTIGKDLAFVPVSLVWNETSLASSCNETCGKIPILYPFGIKRDCSKSDGFNIDCNSSTPYLSAFNNVEVLGFNSEKKTVTVNFPMVSDCGNPFQNNNLELSTSLFHFSSAENMFVVQGCGSAAIMENGTIAGGCSTTCGNNTVSDTNNCFGIGCCQTTISNNLKSFKLNLTGLERQDGNGTCGSAFLVDRKSFIEKRFSGQFIPIALTWETSASYSESCKSCELHGGVCYISPNGVSGMACNPKESSNESYTGLILSVSISIGLLFLTVTSYALYNIIKKAKMKRRKQRFFKRNGGLLLKQQQATDIGLVDKTILFTSDELDKATDNFNENRILGQGGQGTVYKGMLPDGRIVAIKKSKVVDECQLEQFINEVVVLSQVNHRNVVKLLGCCLETEVPLLVSEFISNGTLYDLIQNEVGEFACPLNLRLQIAIEVAEAVSYLHSATTIPIYHRDIKTANILLDEKYKAKVSDFGTSRVVPIDKTHCTTTVMGTFGYLDPEYYSSSQLTEKSDVYSFGVVLLELLTEEKAVFLTKDVKTSLVEHFKVAMKEGRGLSIFDAMVLKEGPTSELLAIAKLSLKCLNLNGKNRPKMKEVAIELEGIRLSYMPSTIQTAFGHVKSNGSTSRSLTSNTELEGNRMSHVPSTIGTSSGHVKSHEEVSQTHGGSTSTSLTFEDDLCR
ncbi:hypothetical protein Lser_V15G06632 [Lactuca serriola]